MQRTLPPPSLDRANVGRHESAVTLERGARRRGKRAQGRCR
jgi:hypothetical protein